MTFEDFWKAYPKKRAKPIAERAWRKIRPNQELAEEILGSIEKFKRSKDWLKDGGEFIPYPATFLNQRRWEDEEDEPLKPIDPNSNFKSLVRQKLEAIRGNQSR